MRSVCVCVCVRHYIALVRCMCNRFFASIAVHVLETLWHANPILYLNLDLGAGVSVLSRHKYAVHSYSIYLGCFITSIAVVAATDTDTKRTRGLRDAPPAAPRQVSQGRHVCSRIVGERGFLFGLHLSDSLHEVLVPDLRALPPQREHA